MSPKELQVDLKAFEKALHDLVDGLGERQNAPVTPSADGQVVFAGQLLTKRSESEVRRLLTDLVARHGVRQNLTVSRTGTQIIFKGQLRPYNPDSAGEMDAYRKAHPS